MSSPSPLFGPAAGRGRSARLALPPIEVALEAPEEFFEALRRLHPRAVEAALAQPPAGRDQPPARRDGQYAARYRVRARRAGFKLSRYEVDHGTFRTALDAALRLEHDLEWDVIRGCRDWVAIHGGAVVVGGAACLVAGPSGSGKTSTTFQLVELGHPFLCEEITLVDPATRAVKSYPQALSVAPAFVAEFQAAHEVTAGELDPVPGTVRYRPRRLGEEAPLGTVLLPRHAPEGGRGELREPPREEALVELLGHCFRPTVDLELFVDRFGAALEGVTLLELIYRDAAEARSLLAERFPCG